MWFGVLKNAHPEMWGGIRAETPTKHIRDPLEDREQSARPGMNIGFHEDGSNSAPLAIPTDDIGSTEAGREGLEESCGDLVINARTHSLPLVQIDEKKMERVARPLGPSALDREEPAKRLLVIGFCGVGRGETRREDRVTRRGSRSGRRPARCQAWSAYVDQGNRPD